MDAVGIALIVIAWRLFAAHSSSSILGARRGGQIPQGLDPVERGLLEDFRRLNEIEPEMRNERGEDSLGPMGEAPRRPD
jgi:hypothetical protein